MQREINDLFKKHLYVRAYINDIMIFNNSLKDHLKHLNQIFSFFQKYEIMLKTSKMYFEYFNISLLNQKINSFDLITASKKLKAIVQLFFSKFLKNLTTYLEMTEWLKNYISYYAQKSEALNKKKTALLQNDSLKDTIRKNFNKKIFLKEFSEEKLKSYHQFQDDFSKSS